MKDLHVQFMTFCDYAITSQEGKLSIIGIFDEVRVSQFPGGIASAALVAIIHGKPDTAYTFTIKGDKGSKNIFQPVELSIKMGMSGASHITMNLHNVGFPEAGEYRFVIYHEAKEIGQTSLKILQTKQQGELKYTLPN